MLDIYQPNMCVILFIVCFLLPSIISDEISNRKFPKHFKFGAGTSAYQIEGGWNTDGKGESTLDFISHFYPEIMNYSTGDVACDSYHKYRDDIEMAKRAGLEFYRFSISWPRILPTGMRYKINQAGIDYYNNLIDGLIEAGIEPVVTLHHWDTPKSVDWLGYWFNPDFDNFFTDYADVVFSLFGDRVKTWFTFNEPTNPCGYQLPSTREVYAAVPNGIIEYKCGHTVLLTHAKVYHLYDKKYRPIQGGRISITLDVMWYEPFSNSVEDIEAAERALQFDFGWLAHPILTGDYPEIMKNRIKEKSEMQKINESRLTPLTLAELAYVKGTFDFLGLNHYTTRLVKNKLSNSTDPSVDGDREVEYSIDPSWENTSSYLIQVVPWGFRKILNWIKRNYGDIEIFVTENGYPGDDEKRIEFHKKYLSALLEAIYEDGVNVTAYSIWSLMDNLEWYAGYSLKFGLYEVDFESENRTRTAKPSVDFYKSVIKTKCLVDNCVEIQNKV